MKLLLVEDDAEFATTLSQSLEALDHQVTVAADGLAAIDANDRERFDAVILDRMLPHMEGTTLVERLRERGQTLPVLMLSALGHSIDKVDGLKAGADDYIVKPTPVGEIDARLTALVRARGWKGEGANTLRAGRILVNPGKHRAWYGDDALDLSNLEFKLLSELARNAGSFVTRTMLLERVWGYDFEPATNIIEVQVRSLRRKLTANGAPDPIVTKRGVGYMLEQ
ncbi:response regulator transcription factor [Sphingomonas sp. RHCKR47]|uniref:response regulator transcription factor n=1 Tax=Sphingomonas citricola TaxID=2862498 RepID=UPI001C67B049|nr:response regulator transcription factor [Sphingomonas citricola]MBW6522776.1 response regulator transcription factor [Sphingomonas citricola]